MLADVERGELGDEPGDSEHPRGDYGVAVIPDYAGERTAGRGLGAAVSERGSRSRYGYDRLISRKNGRMVSASSFGRS
jgi:hypothetical protein